MEVKLKLPAACRYPSAQDALADVIARAVAGSGISLRWGARRIPLSRGRHHGGYVCAFRGEPLVRVESALERRVVKALAADPSCIVLASQPVTVHWTWKGESRRYTPDVLVMFDQLPDAWRESGLKKVSLIEVKPLRFAVEEDLHAERVRVIRESLDMPLVRLPVAQEAQA